MNVNPFRLWSSKHLIIMYQDHLYGPTFQHYHHRIWKHRWIDLQTPPYRCGSSEITIVCFMKTWWNWFWIDRKIISSYIPGMVHHLSFFILPMEKWFEQRVWYKKPEYAREIERGLITKKMFTVYITWILYWHQVKRCSWFSYWSTYDAGWSWTAQRKPDQRAMNLFQRFWKDLQASGEHFIVKRKSTDSYSLIAGYHWFTDWGRDTMIAMRDWR